MGHIFVNWLVIFAGGSLGAMARYLLGSHVNDKVQSRFPLGTLTVNLLGCLLLGFLTTKQKTLALREDLFADVGLIGAFTTFSSLSYETLALIQDGRYGAAAFNPAISTAFGLMGLSLGMLAGHAL